MPLPSSAAERQMSGSELGSIGSVFGGTKKRGPFSSIWCMVRKTCGCQSLYMNRARLRFSARFIMNASRLMSWPAYFW